MPKRETAVWKSELRKHCEEIFVDKEETTVKQKERIMQFKAEGDRQFTKDWSFAGISIDRVHRARARMVEEKGKGQRTRRLSRCRDDQGAPSRTDLRNYEVFFRPASWARKRPSVPGRL